MYNKTIKDYWIALMSIQIQIFLLDHSMKTLNEEDLHDGTVY